MIPELSKGRHCNVFRWIYKAYQRDCLKNGWKMTIGGAVAFTKRFKNTEGFAQKEIGDVRLYI